MTSYAYDVGGRLASVRMAAPSGAVQTRTFDYDPRGFLRWESQPEAGMTSYRYDARGHVLSKEQSGAKTQFDLEYAYDAAERLVQLKARNPRFGQPGQAELRVMKELAYGTDNVASDLRRGKLVSATRFNYGTRGSDDVFRIEDTYRYLDAAGRRTFRTTTIARMAPGEGPLVLKSVDMGITYNAIDRPARIEYPHCLDCGAPTTAPDRTGELYTYVRGRLDAIGGWVGNMTYWPNGMRHTLERSNQLRDVQTSDVMPRPASIRFEPNTQGTAPLERCLRPSLAVQPASTTVPAGGGAATLSVAVAGTGPFEYQWIRASDLEEVGRAAAVTVQVATAEEFYVQVSNACGFETSHRAKVTPGTCSLPTTGTIETVRQPDGRWLLRPGPTAMQQPSFQWRRLSDSVIVGSTETIVVPEPSAATTYRLTISDDCGTGTGDVTITPLPVITRTSLVAARTGTAQVTVSWPAVAGVSHYVVERRAGTSWEVVGEPQGSSWVDTTVAAQRSYVYRAYAVRAGQRSDYSNSDVATTRAFTEAIAGQKINVAPIDDLLAAVNSVRGAVGWSPVAWSNILAASDPLPIPSKLIVAHHVTSARERMNEALTAAGVPIRPYTKEILKGTRISAADVNEVQQRAQ